MPAGGCFTLADIKRYGEQKGVCPYFLARHMLGHANIVVYNYQYLLDPKISSVISKELIEESVVVFDEAHNIDNVCIEVMTVAVNQDTLVKASSNLSRLASEVDKVTSPNPNPNPCTNPNPSILRGMVVHVIML